MKLPLPRSLLLKLASSVAVAFALTMVLAWGILRYQTDAGVQMLFARELSDLRGEVEDLIDRRLILMAMEVRERFSDGQACTVAALKRLAADFRVDEICLVDTEGVVEASNVPHYIGFDFRTHGPQAYEFLCLLDREIEFSQPVRPNPTNGDPTKYTGVWRPEGGFVQIGCTLPTVRRLVQTTVAGVTRNQHLGGIGRVVVTTPEGHVLSDVKEECHAGAIFELPGDDVYWMKDEIVGFPVYLIYPKHEIFRDTWIFLGLVALVTMAALCCIALFVGVAIAGFVREQVQKRQAADMAMAASIQGSSLPRVFPPYPDLVANCDIFAMMRPAKEVGGDFYDFYHTRSDRLALVIADVSGKGVPAALFMMKVKTMLKATLSGGEDLAASVCAVNNALSCENEDGLFVTAWIGVVDLKTGCVTYVNAGHNPPLVKEAAGEVRYLDENPDLPLAAFEGFAYEAHELQLKRGETLLLYTDGITEAKDGVSQFFGEARLKDAFAAAPEAADSVCRTVVALTDAFVARAPQADDMTLLAYRFLAPVVEPLKASLPLSVEAIKMCQRMIAEAQLGPDAAVVMDEIASNIVRCSGAKKFEFEITPARQLVFRDDGKAFDPTRQADPDVTLSAEDREIGGLGIFLVKQLSKGVTYRRDGGWNELVVQM